MSDYRENLQQDAARLGLTGEAEPPERGRVFVNPANGHREEVGEQASLWTFLLGPFYLMARGLWGHALLYMLIIGMSAVFLGPITLVVAPVVWVVYATVVTGIIRGRFQRMGWHDAADWDARPASSATVAVQPPQDVPVAAVGSVADEIRKLAKLRDEGLLTDEEFAAQKAKLL